MCRISAFGYGVQCLNNYCVPASLAVWSLQTGPGWTELVGSCPAGQTGDCTAVLFVALTPEGRVWCGSTTLAGIITLITLRSYHQNLNGQAGMAAAGGFGL